MKFGIIVFPGSNCDRDMEHVLKNVLGAEVEMLWHKDEKLNGYGTEDCIVLPGGFSYGDYLRTGAIARFSPLMNDVIRFANEGGLVLGICNGFQILCEAGLLPGVLLLNDHQKFVCSNQYIRTENNKCRLTRDLDQDQVLSIPIAHADGRYFARPDELELLENNGQVMFRYCDANGEVDAEHNPNGSVNNIAGICNREGNVFGMMPHPERAAEEALANSDGQLILQSLFAQSGVNA